MTFWPKLIIGFAIILALATIGYRYKSVTDQLAVEQGTVKALQAQIVLADKQQTITDKVEASHAAQEAKTQIVYRTIQQQVIRYVKTQASSPSNCTLPAEWVRIHNAAATGTVASSAQ